MDEIDKQILPVTEYMKDQGLTMQSDPRLIALAGFNVGLEQGNKLARETLRLIQGCTKETQQP